MRKLLAASLLLLACTLPGSTRPKGAMGINEGDWNVKILADGREIVVDCSQFDTYSGSQVISNKESTEIAISCANDKNDRGMNIIMDFPAHDKGTFPIQGSDLPTGSFTMTSTDYPTPPGSILVAKSGSISIQNYPAVNGFTAGECTANCQFMDNDGKLSNPFQVKFKFHVKRLQ